MSDWFAIHVRAGCEADALSLLRQNAPSSGVEELFVPGAEVRAQGGDSGREVVPLVPGCVVAVAPSGKEVRRALRRTRDLADLVPDGGGFVALDEDEAALLNALARPGGRVAGFSEGRQERGRLVVERGALAGRESLVRAVSHRKKRAYLSLTFAGREVDAQVGLRVTRGKTGAEGPIE